MMFSYLRNLRCSKCSKEYDAGRLNTVCSCGSPLLATYDHDSLVKDVRPGSIENRDKTLWRYHELLPVIEPSNVVSLGEGLSPMVASHRLGPSMGVNGLFIKDESSLPTGTFKARGAAVGVSKARELGVTRVALPTNGNAGAAWSAYCARAGIEAYVVMSKDAPSINRVECTATGAKLYTVDGGIGDAGEIVRKSSSSKRLFDASTMKEPYRVEGKKTIGLEIMEQFKWKAPEVVICPSGGGVGLIGVYKAIQELTELDWIHGGKTRLVAVQSEGCAPIVDAWNKRARECTAWQSPSTVAFGINVAKPFADRLILEALYSTDGCAIAVSDKQILEAQKQAGRLEGLFICPEGAAAVAAVAELREKGWIEAGENVVVLNTGTGIKYPHLVDVQPVQLSKGSEIS
ncbi:MAG: threonine synthase [Thermoprotei archaeon]